MSNQAAYSDAEVVREYAAARDLLAPEVRILGMLSDRLAGMAMLDVGVGGGRTTRHFAPRVREYVGTDFALPMVEACREAFAAHPEWTFRTCDARDMREFEDGRFDFVCFSFNGLDYVSHEDRLAALRELRRVCRPGGTFAFSSHNLQNAADIWKWHWPGAWRHVPKAVVAQVLKRILNLGYLVGGRREHARLNDGCHRFKLRTYYIRPAEQIRQLETAGFTGTRVLSFVTGEEISGPGALDATRDPSPYYVCTRPPSR